MRASKQFRDGRFHNTSGAGPAPVGNLLPLMAEFAFGGPKRRPEFPLPVESPRDAWRSAAESGLRITWLGHSTLLLEVDGHRILTDPVFGERASPVSFAGPKRFHPTPVALRELPPLSAVLLSHDHYDHLCATTMTELARSDVPVVTSLGVGAALETLGIPANRITELDWWESWTIPNGDLTFTATPAQHFSGRSFADRNRTLWSSWVMASERHRLFFSGDTGHTDEFLDIGQRFGPFDVAMLEIGAWHAAWGAIHLGPENAVRAFEQVRGKALLPIHWGTFDLALHPWNEPAETLLAHAGPKGLRVLTPPLGRAFEPDRAEGTPRWWRSAHQERSDPARVREATERMAEGAQR
jgi:L-ascorbate metabolism protein UlaG (beta-lactamase superfamily)